MKHEVRKDILYPELSYKILGILFDVYNSLGDGYREKYYENAVEIALRDSGIEYKKQLHVPLKYKTDRICDYFFDFLVGDAIVLELKRGNRFSRENIEQVYEYLKSRNLKLGIIAQFTSDGVKSKRIVNIK